MIAFSLILSQSVSSIVLKPLEQLLTQATVGSTRQKYHLYHETSTGFFWKSYWNNGKDHMGQNFRTVGQPFKLPVSFAGSADGFDNFPVSW